MHSRIYIFLLDFLQIQIMEQIISSYIENQSDEVVKLTFDPSLNESWKQIEENMSALLTKKKSQIKQQYTKKSSFPAKQACDNSKTKNYRSRMISEGHSKQAYQLITFKTKILEPIVHNPNAFHKLKPIEESQNKSKAYSSNKTDSSSKHYPNIGHQQSRQKPAFFDFNNKENIQQLKNRIKRINRMSELNVRKKSLIKNPCQVVMQQLNVTLQGQSLELTQKTTQTPKLNTVKKQLPNKKSTGTNFLLDAKKRQNQQIFTKNNKITKQNNKSIEKQVSQQLKKKKYLNLTQKLYENNSKQLLKYSQDKYIHSNLKLSYKSKQPLRKKLQIIRN